MLAACGQHSAAIPQTQNLPSSVGGGRIVPSARTTQSVFTKVLDNGMTASYFPTRQDYARAQTLGLIAPSKSDNLNYGGGPIQASPKMYIVFWGKAWSSKSGDPDGVQKVLRTFTKGLNGSQWTGTLTQYYGPVKTFIKNTTTLAGAYVDSANQPPQSPTDGQIGAEAARAAKHFGDYTNSASYVVAMPHGILPAGFGTEYCAWHSNETENGNPIAFTNLPYMPDPGQACGAGSVNSPGTDDGVSIVEGHEQGETETDPQPFSGWNGPLGEIGDACAWQDLQNTKFSTGTFPTQPLWSNKLGACKQ